jgi:2-polyprenyl-3-methyl-5-hydroxy-6-metoxy-1,4-benzoquinol methylase
MKNTSDSKISCKLCETQKVNSATLELENLPTVAQFYPTDASHSRLMLGTIFVWQCEFCGLTQIANRPVPYFKEVIRATKVSGEMLKARDKQFAEFIEKYGLQESKIIEVGCGAGENLAILGQHCSASYGIEYSQVNVDQCKNLNLPVQKGFPSFDDGHFEHGPFDAFFSFNVLEHVTNPREWLQVINQNLNPGGVGIVEVPNFDMIEKDGLTTEFVTEHLMYFTRETLRLMLEINGFQVLSIESKFANYVLSAHVKKRSAGNFTKFIDFLDRMTVLTQNLKTKFPEKGLVIWGAGHQSLAFINQFQLSEHVNFIVDSAKSKQGKFAPGTELEIRNPEVLTTNKGVRCILVIAAGYNDEIVQILKSTWLKEGRTIYTVWQDSIEEIDAS